MINIHDELIANDSPTAYRFCCPILIGNSSFGTLLEPPEKLLVQPGEDLPALRSGTLTLVRLDDDIYGITCAHVIDALDAAVAKSIAEHEDLCGKGAVYPLEVWPRFFFPKGAMHVDVNILFERAPGMDADMAAGWVSPEVFSAIGREAIDIGAGKDLPQLWPSDAGALASGYPEPNRRIYGRNTSDDTLAIANVTLHAGIEKPRGRQIRIVSELPEGQSQGADVLSGMSGGPILVSCGDQWGLVGIVSGGSDINSYAKTGGAGFFQGPAINIHGEAFDLPELRLWLISLKGRTTGLVL